MCIRDRGKGVAASALYRPNTISVFKATKKETKDTLICFLNVKTLIGSKLRGNACVPSGKASGKG